MKRNFIFSAMLVVILLTASNLVVAQNTKTLDDCIKICLKNNTDIVQANSNFESAKADLKSARGNFLPSVNGLGNWRRRSEDFFNIRFDELVRSKKSYYYEFSLDQPLFTGFSNYAMLKQGLAQKRMRQYEMAWTKQQTVLVVKLQYYAVLKAIQLLKVADETLNASNEELVRLETMEKIGSISKAEVYQQKVRVGENKLAFIDAQNNVSKTKADLNATMGIDINSKFNLAEESLEMQKIDLIFDILLEKALKNRIDYLAAKEMVTISKAGITISRSEYFPQLGLTADYSWWDVKFPKKKADFTAFDNYSVSLNVRMNIFNGLKTKSNVEKSKAKLMSSEAQFEQVKRQVTLDVKKAILDIQQAAENVEVTNENLVSSEEDYRLASERYKIGAGTLLEQITAESNLTKAKASRIQALYDYKYSMAYLDLTVGNLNKNY